jgi:hypothetical protein
MTSTAMVIGGGIVGLTTGLAWPRAAQLTDGQWSARLIDLIESTPEERILHNQVMVVPTLDWHPELPQPAAERASWRSSREQRTAAPE